MDTMINIRFPDNSVKKFEKGTSSLDIAMSISPGLARQVYAATVNGEVRDLNMPVNEDASVIFHKWEDDEAR
ncbi:MAG: TGS domain-containing protein, partial [Bacteroidales bacterium]|nr:TGS domain-containing protein [Bacteroidales bacterium]